MIWTQRVHESLVHRSENIHLPHPTKHTDTFSENNLTLANQLNYINIPDYSIFLHMAFLPSDYFRLKTVPHWSSMKSGLFSFHNVSPCFTNSTWLSSVYGVWNPRLLLQPQGVSRNRTSASLVARQRWWHDNIWVRNIHFPLQPQTSLQEPEWAPDCSTGGKQSLQTQLVFDREIIWGRWRV